MTNETKTQTSGNAGSATTVEDFLGGLGEEQMPGGKSLAGFDSELPIGISSVKLDRGESESEEEGDSKEPTVAELKQRMGELEKKLEAANAGYSGSSAEARRLRAELDDLKNQVVSRKENEEAPKDLFEALGIDKENFVMDWDDAIKNPNSDSYRFYHAQIALEAARQVKRLQEENERQKSTQELQKQFDDEKKALMKEYNLTEEQFEDWLEKKGKNVRLNLHNAYLLTNQEKFVENAVKKLREQKTVQSRAVQGLPKTIASQKGGQRPSASQVFQDAIAKSRGVDLSRL